MRRAFHIAIAIGCLVAILALGAAVLLLTPAGRTLIGDAAERQIEKLIGGDVAIGAVAGRLPHRIVLENLRFKDDGNLWASVGRVTIAWSPSALLSKRLVIETVLVEGGLILAHLPQREDVAKPFRGFELPEKLPFVTVSRLTLQNFQIAEALVGTPLRIDGDGSLALGGRALALALNVSGTDDRDLVSIEVERNPESGALSLSAAIASKENGALATLSGSDGPLALRANGAGAWSDFQVALSASAGTYGSLEGIFTANIQTLDAIRFDLSAMPGSRSDPWRTDIGDAVRLSGNFMPKDAGGRLQIDALTAGFGAASGEAHWRNTNQALQLASATLKVDFSADWRGDLQRALGNNAILSIAVESKGKAYTVEADAIAPFITASTTGLQTDLRTRASGKVSFAASEQSSLAASLRSAFRAEANVAAIVAGMVRLDTIEASTATGVAFKGKANYDLALQAVSVEGALSASAAAINGYVPSLVPRAGAIATIMMTGPVEDLTLRVEATSPQLRLNNTPFPAAKVSIALSGLPKAINGAVSGRTLDGALRSSAKVSQLENGAWRLSAIDHRGAAFALTGEASVNPRTTEGAADLRYIGGENAEPWPGLRLAGEITAKGNLSRQRADNRIEIQSPGIQSSTWSAGKVSLSLAGPFNQLAFALSAENAAPTPSFTLESVRANGVATIAGGPHLSIDAASADYFGGKAVLTRPAIIDLSTGVAIQSLAMTIGESGFVEFEGSLEPARWRANALVRDVAMTGGSSSLNFQITLDTDDRIAASGAFEASSTLAGPSTVTLPGTFTWDGRQIVISAGAEGGALDIDLSVPARLVREKGLKVDLDGELAGNARFKGRAETVAVFLPLELQAIEGDLDFDGMVSGPMISPRIAGNLVLSKGSFTELASGLSIVAIDARATASGALNGSTIVFDATASGPGQPEKSVKASGTITVDRGITLAATIGLDRARFSVGPVERLDATGKITIAGASDDLLVSGDIAINALEARLFTPPSIGLVDIEVVAIGKNNQSAAVRKGARSSGTLRYAIRIDADDKIEVRGRGLYSEWRAKAQLAGRSDRPLVLGTLNLRQGDLEFSGRRFNITRGAVVFDQLAPNDPILDLRAERSARDGTTVAVVISGRSSALKVSLESTPSLPSEDVMALVLFDKSANELSAFQSLQVADALTQLGGVGVFGGKGITGAARDALGLDLLNLDVDQADSSASLLTVGKYVSDGLFVSASQNARGENGSVRIEYEIGQSFSIETELRQDGDQTVSANWKKDF
ncbi:MAG: translocation/assembly module TamB domain-containing protein [Parvularculaceae bacterium]